MLHGQMENLTLCLKSVSTRNYTKGGGMTIDAICLRYLSQTHLLYFARKSTFKALSHFKHMLFSASSHQEYRETYTLILDNYRNLLTNVVVNMIEKKGLNLISSKFFEQSFKCFLFF